MKTHQMKKHTKVVLLVIGGLALTTSAVMAGMHYAGYGCGAEGRGEHVVQRLTEELELNPAQHQQLVALKDALLSAREAIRGGREEVRDEVMQLLSAPSLDRGAALALINSRAQAVQEEAPNLVNAVGDFYDGLSAEQRAELREHIEARHAFRQRILEHRGWHSKDL